MPQSSHIEWRSLSIKLMDAESRVLVARIRKEHELAAMGFCSWRMKVREREEGREGEKERGTERE